MSDQALIVIDSTKQVVTWTQEAVTLKESALTAGALIGRVGNADEQAAAVVAQRELQTVLSLAEKAREAAKAPVLKMGRLIDERHKSFTTEVKAEMARISTMVGSFQQLEQQRAWAAEKAQREELSRLEREKAAAMAKATTEGAQDAVQAHFNEKAALVASQPVAAPARVEGQRVTNDWTVTVTDIHLLYRAHPNCVKLEPLVSEIKSLLKMGVTPKGVLAVPIVKAMARGSMTNAIEV